MIDFLPGSSVQGCKWAFKFLYFYCITVHFSLLPVNICFMCIEGTCIGWTESYKFGNKSWIHKKSIDIQISILCTFFFDREVIMQYIYLIKYLHAEYGKNYKITTKCIWMKDLSRQFIKLNIQIVTRSKGSPLSVVIREMQTIVSY